MDHHDDANASAPKRKNLYTIPLIPHHEHRRRRLLEEGLEQNTTSTTNSTEQYQQTKRPTQYPRFLKKLRSNNRQQQQQPPIHLFQGLGTHYADLWCGTPPQRQTVIVDTGSQMTAFPCSQCSAGVYHHIDDPFRQELSRTFREPSCTECTWGDCRADREEGKRCTFTADYQEGSNWTAVEAMDTCYIGGKHNSALATTTTSLPWGGFASSTNPHAFELRFGCQTKISGDFVSQLADGIMGMDIGTSTIWNQMYRQKKIDTRAFALCFQRKLESARSGTESGAMTLGGADERLHDHPMVYTPTEPGSLYAVRLRRLYLRKGGSSNGESVLLPPGESPTILPVPLPEELNEPGKRHVIVDSGTTDSYFSSLYVIFGFQSERLYFSI